MPTVIHCCVSVRWMLGWTRSEAKRKMRGVNRPDGTAFASVDEFRNALMDMLANGTDVLPLGEKCEGWSPKTGCPGHKE